jgi:hypothetical protein
MRLLRALAGAVLWIVAGLLGLVGIVLCLTGILLPLGIPLVGVAGRLLTRAVQLMLPRSLAHPLGEATKKGRKAKADTVAAVGDMAKQAGKTVRKQRKRVA